MNKKSSKDTTHKIASIIHNYPLASAIHRSVASALINPIIFINNCDSVWDIFKGSLDAAIRDIEEHPRGKLFRRLIEYGPHHPDDPKSLKSDGETTLSDPECGLCVQFIFSHMINRFKGELAELLSLEPCLQLVDQLKNEGLLPKGINLYWGDMVQERRRINITRGNLNTQWGSYTKGADGLIVEQLSSKIKSSSRLKIHGVIEVKSMALHKKKVLAQIERHILRLNGGVKLMGIIWPPDKIGFSNIMRIMVVPSTWRLSREWHSVKTDRGRKIVFPEPAEPPIKTSIDKLQPNIWKIKLAWSQESLNQAAYEMTYWYMSQVGKKVYAKKNLPKGWEYMTSEEAGYNAIKMMLYYIPLRYITERKERLAIRLYNVYSFGYPLGVDSKKMLWPEDFSASNRLTNTPTLNKF
jgi:hypothetical protein